MAGGFQAPLVKSAGLFQAFTRNLAYAVSAYLDQRVAAGEALPETATEDAPDDEAPVAEVGAEDAPVAAGAEDAPSAEAAEAAEPEGEPEAESAPPESAPPESE